MSAKPNFFIVGAPKCGTTAMHSYLRQHPDIFMPVEKEPSYFNIKLSSPNLQRYQGNLEKYLSLFEGVSRESMIGEASPGYLYSDIATREIFEFDPNAKIIIMLREPVDMINSRYQHRFFMGDETAKSLEEVIRNEIANTINQPESYLERVRYSPHIKRYFDTFGRSQVHVILFDDMRADLSSTYRRVLEFLDVDPTFRPDFKIINSSKAVRETPIHDMMQSFGITPQSLRDSTLFHRLTGWMPPSLYRLLIDTGIRFYSRPQSKGTISPDLAHQIYDYLQADVDEVSQLLNCDLSSWSVNPPIQSGNKNI